MIKPFCFQLTQLFIGTPYILIIICPYILLQCCLYSLIVTIDYQLATNTALKQATAFGTGNCGYRGKRGDKLP